MRVIKLQMAIQCIIIISNNATYRKNVAIINIHHYHTQYYVSIIYLSQAEIMNNQLQCTTMHGQIPNRSSDHLSNNDNCITTEIHGVQL